ncbi:MAG TPA: V-type ATP synthase subunit E [Vicinamibacteria bacterium]
MRTLGSVASVVAAIADEVEAEVEAVRRRAGAARSALAAVESEREAEPAEREARLVAARQQARERLARADWQASREALTDRERWMTSVAEAGLRRLAAPASVPAARRRELLALVREAVEALPGAAFDAAVSPSDAALLGPQATSGPFPGLDVRVVADATVKGGCRVTERGGRTSFDNTDEARVRRLEPEWRAALGQLYGP